MRHLSHLHSHQTRHSDCVVLLEGTVDLILERWLEGDHMGPWGKWLSHLVGEGHVREMDGMRRARYTVTDLRTGRPRCKECDDLKVVGERSTASSRWLRNGTSVLRCKGLNSTKAWMTLEEDSSSETPGRKTALLTLISTFWDWSRERVSHTSLLICPAARQKLHVALSHCSFWEYIIQQQTTSSLPQRQKESEKPGPRQTDTAQGAKSTINNPRI